MHEFGEFAIVLMRRRVKFRRLREIFADSAYARNDLPAWVRTTFGWVLQTVLRPVQTRGFVVLPNRWIVVRTFAWIAPLQLTDENLAAERGFVSELPLFSGQTSPRIVRRQKWP